MQSNSNIGDQVTPSSHAANINLTLPPLGIPPLQQSKTPSTEATLRPTNGAMPKSFSSTYSSKTSTEAGDVQPEPYRPSSRQSRAASAASSHNNGESCYGAGDMERRGGHEKKTLVLCFDGTGNKFKGNSGDTNILKIFSMLDRRKGDQYHYYQPGIGTYLSSHAITHRTGRGMSTRLKSAYQKAIDAAVGTSFDQHVMGGYRFLMRYYHPGDDIYMFGFSRGAYTARFLCEMLDHVGLVVQGNEEMVHFAWKTFSQWQMRAHDSSERGKRKKEEMYNYMRAFRETFTRPVKRVRFLGLFDTVNSVPRFEKAWLKRGSRFPYTARSTARVIRHAVGLDERRAKFRQDLVEKVNLAEISHSLKQGIKDHLEPEKYKDRKKNRKRSWGEKEPSKKGVAKMGLVKAPLIALNGKVGGIKPAGPPDPSLLRMSNGYVPGAEDRPAASLVSLGIHFDREDGDDDDTEQDVEELWFPGCHGDIGGGWDLAPGEPNLSYGPLVWMVREARKAGLTFDERRLRDLGCYTDLQAMYDNEQGETVDESDLIIEIQRATPRNSPPIVEDPEKSMLFNGFGGGQATNGNGHRTYASGHGGPDDEETGDEDESELKRPPPQQDPIHTGSTHSSSRNVDSPGHPLSATPPRAPRRPEVDGQTTNRLVDAFTKGRIHCCLTFGGGLPPMSTLGWRMMEYLPFRRMDLQPDGSWKAITWPLPRGEVRDVPDDAKIHGSVLVRMKADEGYRPGNLLVGGGGRGVRVAPEEYGTGEWVVLREEGSLVGEVLMKKSSFRPKVEGLRK